MIASSLVEHRIAGLGELQRLEWPDVDMAHASASPCATKRTANQGQGAVE